MTDCEKGEAPPDCPTDCIPPVRVCTVLRSLALLDRKTRAREPKNHNCRNDVSAVHNLHRVEKGRTKHCRLGSRSAKKKGAPPHSAQLRSARTREEHTQAVPHYGTPTLVRLTVHKLAV